MPAESGNAYDSYKQGIWIRLDAFFEKGVLINCGVVSPLRFLKESTLSFLCSSKHHSALLCKEICWLGIPFSALRLLISSGALHSGQERNQFIRHPFMSLFIRQSSYGLMQHLDTFLDALATLEKPYSPLNMINLLFVLTSCKKALSHSLWWCDRALFWAFLTIPHDCPTGWSSSWAR